MKHNIIIVGGGAGGFFTAINLAQKLPHIKISILEKNNSVLNKVRVSGGGRCNITNSEKNISQLLHNYPRGFKELISSFNKFKTDDLFLWFKKLNIELKTEKDGRVFPQSNSSQTIIDCFMNEAKKLNIDYKLKM